MVLEEPQSTSILDEGSPFIQDENKRNATTFTDDLIDLTDDNNNNNNNNNLVSRPSLSFFTPPPQPEKQIYMTATSKENHHFFNSSSGGKKASNIPIRFKPSTSSTPTTSNNYDSSSFKNNDDASFLSPKSTMRKISNTGRTDYSSFNATATRGSFHSDDFLPIVGEGEKLPELMKSTILSPLETMRKISQSTTPLKPVKEARKYGGLVGTSPSNSNNLLNELKNAEKISPGKSPIKDETIESDSIVNANAVTPRQDEILSIFRRSLSKCTDELRDKVQAQEAQVEETKKVTASFIESVEAETETVIKKDEIDQEDVYIHEEEVEEEEEMEPSTELSFGQRFVLALFIVTLLVGIEWTLHFFRERYLLVENEVLYHVPGDNVVTDQVSEETQKPMDYITETVGLVWKQTVDSIGSFFINWNHQQPQ